MQTLTKLTELLEPTIESMGYEIVHMEFNGSTLRIYIDAPGGIEVGDCALVSRQVSAIMDVEDPLKNAYNLEISSPGLDRPLVKPAHFKRVTGELAKIVMHTHVLGRRRFVGVLVEANDEVVVLEADGESYDLPYELMESARLEPVFEGERLQCNKIKRINYGN